MDTRKYVARYLRLKDIYFEDVINGKKNSTIRFGYVLFSDVFIDLIFDTKASIKISIAKLDYSKTFGTISQEDAINDGYESLTSLLNDLRKYYPNIQNSSPITICYFKILT